MPSVTVLGAHGPVTLQLSSAQQAAIAQQLAAVVNAGIVAGTITPVEAVGVGAPPLPPGVTGELVIQKSGPEVLSPGYGVVVANAANVVVFGDGQQNQIVLSGKGGLTDITNGGSGTIVAGGGSNALYTSGGDWYVATGGGNDSIVAGGSGDTIAAGLGNNQIVLGRGTALIATTGLDLIQGGSGAATVAVGTSGHAYYQGGSGTLLFIDSGMGSTVMGGTGSETIFGSTGQYTGGSNGNNLIYGGGTLTGGGAGDSLFATGSAGTVLQAGSGNETLSAALSLGKDTLIAGLGADSLVAGYAQATLVANIGADTLVGGGSSDTFVFNAATSGGTILIQDFTGADVVHLSGYDQNEAHNAVLNARIGAAGVTLTLHDNTKITFAGITDANRITFG